MKLLPLLVSFIVVLTVDCRGQSEEHGEQPRTLGAYQLHGEPVASDIGMQDRRGKSLRKTYQSKCKAKSLCSSQGGKCVTNAKLCKGRLVPDGCTGQNCHCCVIGCPKEFINMPGPSNQCYQLFNQFSNWTSAKSACHNNGLKLARIYNAIELRSYIAQKYGSIAMWVDARGDGSSFRWQSDHVSISASSPLWYVNHPRTYVTNDYCPVFTAHDTYWKSYLTKPYITAKCSGSHYALCEANQE